MVAIEQQPTKSGRQPMHTAHAGQVASILSKRAKSSRTALLATEQARSISYAELACLARELAEHFLRHGLQPRDRVAILLPTSIEFAAAFFGASAAGAAVAPMDVFMKRADLFNVLGTLQPAMLVTNPSLFRKIRHDRVNATVCVLEFNGALSISFVSPTAAAGESKESKAEYESAPTLISNSPDAEKEDAVVILSSGSMGVPKAVRLSHRAVLRNIAMHLESLELTDDIRSLQVLPLNYSYGLIASFLSTLHSGGTIILPPDHNPARVAEALTSYDVNLVMGTPAIFQYAIEKSPPGFDFRAAPVCHLTLGGDRCRPYTLNLVTERLPSAKIYMTYGLTEAGPRVSTLPPRFVKTFPNSVGAPLRGVEVSILDNRLQPRGPREIGEIVIRTPSLMNGYLGDPLQTKRVIREGRCHTGDLGFLDERGFLYCLGRKDRQFKLGGRLINPDVIEQCVASHPAVQVARVQKREDSHREWLCASVKSQQPPTQELLEDLKRHCLRGMPAHLIPDEFRFETGDRYYHKGRLFRPTREELSNDASPENSLRSSDCDAVVNTSSK